jgi:lipopolysaccharide transport system permease protein
VKEESNEWTTIIRPKSNIFDLKLREIWEYRDLIMIFVNKEIVSFYKQTILGPLWFFIQPLLTTLVYTIVFGKIAGIPTDGKPPILFYLSGIVIWNFFSDCLLASSNTFITNAAVFGKVYFPRVISPLSKVISNLLKLFIQIGLFLLIYLYYLWKGGIHFNMHPLIVIILPLCITIAAIIGLAWGMIISSLTTKYRDLVFLVTFGVQLLMYATPVIYSMNKLSGTKYYTILKLNPLTGIIESFRSVLFGEHFNVELLMYSLVLSVISLLLGIIIFNNVEKGFIDTV